MQELRQSTEITVRCGPFVDFSDGVTLETGVTLSGADQAELLKHNGVATVDISSATWAAVSGAAGWYDLTLTTSHTDTLGCLDVVVQDADVCLPFHKQFMITAQNWWDSKYSTDNLQVDVTQVEGSDATDQIRDSIVDDATRIDASALNTASTAISSDGSGLSAIPWNASWDAEVQSECNDAIVAVHLDHLFAVDYDPASKPGVATALLNELVESDGGVSRFTANALERVINATLTELSTGEPSATPDLDGALMLLYMALRNEGTQNDTVRTIKNDAGTTIAQASVSEDTGTGTFTKGKFGAP